MTELSQPENQNTNIELSPEKLAVQQLTTKVEDIFKGEHRETDPRFGAAQLPEGFEGTHHTLSYIGTFPRKLGAEEEEHFFITKGTPFDESASTYVLSILRERYVSDSYTWTEGDESLTHTGKIEYPTTIYSEPTPVDDPEVINTLLETVKKGFPEAEPVIEPKGRVQKFLAQRALKRQEKDRRELDKEIELIKAGKDPRSRFDKTLDKLLGE